MGKRMTAWALRREVDEAQVMAAIQRAEARTTGEVRVSVAAFAIGNLQSSARRAFERLGMHRTARRNGVLIYVVPLRRAFVVLGDEGIHAKVGQPFWDAVAASMSERFRAGDFTLGLVKGIDTVGEQLAAHFPAEGGSPNPNELPDAVDFRG